MTNPLPKPFRRYRQVQRKYDAELARTLMTTAAQIRSRIQRLPVGIGGEVRKAQLTLVLRQIDRLLRAMFGGPVLDSIQAGRKEAAEAAETAMETLTAVAYAALPPDVAQALVDGLDATAASGIASDFARVPRALSTRVYRTAALSSGLVNTRIREGLISGLSAKELAATVYDLINPNTKGGVSYAAMRLARTEINNAFHERQIEAANRPGVKAIRWNLSESHRVPDKCNLYAERDSHKQGKGVFPIGQVPDKPHPHCFCYLTYVTMNPREFREALMSGDFDAELDRRTRANIQRLSIDR